MVSGVLVSEWVMRGAIAHSQADQSVTIAPIGALRQTKDNMVGAIAPRDARPQKNYRSSQ
ncbi:MAG: hypothetical protein DSM106950_41935 [Stigonema ocellatum SAG 48.90 = DSM 106950]|nr:hypothetical protein [Stigonema ocellatum SAG 48.90 = DSM 106950]